MEATLLEDHHLIILVWRWGPGTYERYSPTGRSRSGLFAWALGVLGPYFPDACFGYFTIVVARSKYTQE